MEGRSARENGAAGRGGSGLTEGDGSEKAEQGLGRAMAALIWYMVKQAGVGRRQPPAPDLA